MPRARESTAPRPSATWALTSPSSDTSHSSSSSTPSSHSPSPHSPSLSSRSPSLSSHPTVLDDEEQQSGEDKSLNPHEKERQQEPDRDDRFDNVRSGVPRRHPVCYEALVQRVKDGSRLSRLIGCVGLRLGS